MAIMRIVVTGPVGSGKSTFVRTVSEIQTVDTDRQATDETALLKATTTVAMDFGRVTFGNKMSLHVYGTPGQERFDFMWEILIEHAHAYILLVPGHQPGAFRTARRILTFMEQRVRLPYLVGVTHLDVPQAWPLPYVGMAVGVHPDLLLAVNATQKPSVVSALVQLIQRCHTRRTQSQLSAQEV
ncbi:MAG: ATP/GTP-binding protein [Gloeomargarita sp. DG02_4_bins_56]